MNSYLFGSRGPYECPVFLPTNVSLYPSSTRNHPRRKGYLSNDYGFNNGYNYSNNYGYAQSQAYPQFPAYQLHPALQQVSSPTPPCLIPPCQYQYLVPWQPPGQFYPYSQIGWKGPEVIIPTKGIETILIAILILVALDILFVRSRR